MKKFPKRVKTRSTNTIKAILRKGGKMKHRNDHRLKDKKKSWQEDNKEEIEDVVLKIPFKTTPEQITFIPTIISEMNKAGLDNKLITMASELAKTDQGIFELMGLWIMHIWFDPDNVNEISDILKDLEESVNDYGRKPDSSIKKAVSIFQNPVVNIHQ